MTDRRQRPGMPAGHADWRPGRAASRAPAVHTQSRDHEDHLHLDWVSSVERLPEDVCDELVEIGRSFPAVPPTVVSQELLREHRVGQVHMLPNVRRTRRVYQLLWNAAHDATVRHYALALSRIARQPQYVEYHAGRGHFHWHDDYSHESEESPRKLTVIIQLSDGDDYQGGDLEVFGFETATLPRERGTIICLPSFVPHRVSAVTAGVRRVIVAWIAGPRLV